MRYFKYVIILLLILGINGCSTKNVEEPEVIKTKIEKSDDNSTQGTQEDDFSEEDAFLDEFEEEMKVEEVSDPFSGFNRAMTSFNDGLFRYVLTPVAKGYRYVVPKGARESIQNFFHNLMYPVRGINNLLQGKLTNTAEETGRFVINTTVGIFGLFDPARSWFGLEPHEEDFGQTLGYYGVGGGPHIVLPFFGPSNLRDMFSMYPDSVLDPTSVDPTGNLEDYHIPDTYAQYLFLEAADKVNSVSLQVGAYEDLTKDAVDLYPYLRDMYEQRRKKLIEE